MKKHIFKGDSWINPEKLNKNQINSSKFAKKPIIRQLELVLVAEKRPKKPDLTHLGLEQGYVKIVAVSRKIAMSPNNYFNEFIEI